VSDEYFPFTCGNIRFAFLTPKQCRMFIKPKGRISEHLQSLTGRTNQIMHWKTSSEIHLRNQELTHSKLQQGQFLVSTRGFHSMVLRAQTLIGLIRIVNWLPQDFLSVCLRNQLVKAMFPLWTVGRQPQLSDAMRVAYHLAFRHSHTFNCDNRTVSVLEFSTSCISSFIVKPREVAVKRVTELKQG